MNPQNTTPLPTLLNHRRVGLCPSIVFWNRIVRERPTPTLSSSPTLESLDSSITCLCLDSQHRFLLSGSGTGTISIYDLSKWGSIGYTQGQDRTHTLDDVTQQQRYKPIARSVRDPAVDSHDIPLGHSTAIRNVTWYTDPGAFVSASTDGVLLVWDTNTMQPVASYSPLQHDASIHHQSSSPPLHCMEASCLDPNVLAVASPYVAAVKLVDVRSGASRHELVGHVSGVQSLAWNPQNMYTLASGGVGGTIRLWDIRKAGSKSCLMILDKTQSPDPTRSTAFDFNYKHLQQRQSKKHGKEKPKASVIRAPNDYRATTSTQSTSLSHTGPVTGLVFDSGGLFLMSSGADGKLNVWDLRSANGQWVPRSFLTATGHQPVQSGTHGTPMALDNDLLWIGRGTTLLGFDWHQGGRPRHVLKGHLARIQAIQAVSEDWNLHLLTGGSDGLILTWGKAQAERTKPKRQRQDVDSW